MQNITFISIVLLLLICGLASGQETGTHPHDTIQKTDNKNWRHNRFVPKTLLRIGAGYQKSFYSELGITRINYGGEDLFVFGTTYYGAIEWAPILYPNKTSVYGVKAGCEFTTQLSLMGIEAKYQTDFSNSDFVITPKIGVGEGWFTHATISYIFISYGYNISFYKRPFEGIGAHQISIVINPIVLSYIFNKKNYLKKFNKHTVQ